MPHDLVLYTHPQSRGRTARWMLEEVGEPYDLHVMQYGTTMKSPNYLAINPMGKVPALRHGEAVVTEVAAICAYLADAFPGAQLAPPPGDPSRGAYYRWLFFAAGPLEAAATDRMLGVTPPPARQRAIGYGTLEHVLDAFDQALSASEWLAGPRFTAADLYAAAQLGALMSFQAIDTRPSFVRFVEQAHARPAWRRAAEADDTLLAAAQA